MEKRFKGIICSLLTVAIIVFSGLLVSCGNYNDEEIDETKTNIYVYNFDGGIGTKWLYNVEKVFEEKYKNESFEPNKVGVDIHITPSKSVALSGLSNSSYNIIFTESVFLSESHRFFLDISDVVTTSLEDVSGGKETGTIKEKLDSNVDDFLTAFEGKYYALPHYETYAGITYDVDVFYEYELFIKDGGGYTGIDEEKSVGPDGVRGTYDDGLPSSFEEFYNLLEKMVVEKVVPFIYSGMYPEYTNELVLGSWASYSGYDQLYLTVNFDSTKNGKNVKNETVTGFDSNGRPIVSLDSIDSSKGYLTMAQLGKYYGMEFLSKVLSKSAYYSDSISGVMTHLEAQEEYIFSNLEGKPIAMLIEGSYWYNEAHDAFLRSINVYKERAKDRNFAWMPLPVQYSGQVSEGEGKQNTLVDPLSSYCFINANIKDNTGLVKACKTFLKFLYTDEQLQAFTMETGVAKGVKYQLTSEQYNSLPRYAKSLYDLKTQSNIVNPVSNNPIYVANQTKFAYNNGASYWKSGLYISPYQGFDDGVSAKDYFLGNIMSNSDWSSQFSRYYAGE